jgi:hypothetical protein
MKLTLFDSNADLPPIPFDKRHCELAKVLKDNGLPWEPHVGCFVWDRDGLIEVSSPFPQRIYFILNMGHFLKLFETVEKMAKQLIWVPTWHQARILCAQFSVDNQQIGCLWHSKTVVKPGDDLLLLYEMILGVLQQRHKTS